MVVQDREGGYGVAMSTRIRLAAFALVLGATFATGWGIGAAVGPLDEAPAPTPSTTPEPGTGATEEPAPVDQATSTTSTTADHTEHEGAHR